MWNGFSWLSIGTDGGSCERGGEPPCSGAAQLYLSTYACSLQVYNCHGRQFRYLPVRSVVRLRNTGLEPQFRFY